MVGANVLGHPVESVPHLVHAANRHNRPMDLSDIKIVGEKLEDVASFHLYDFPYSIEEDGEMPVPLAKDGIKGLYYRKYDLSMCTYCSEVNGLVLSAIRYAWKGEPWDGIEVLTGKKNAAHAGHEENHSAGEMHEQTAQGQPGYQ